MNREPEPTDRWLRRGLPPTLVVCLFFLGLQLRLVPHPLDEWASELAQLALAATAAAFAFRAAARGRGSARPFWNLIGLGMASWAAAEGLWALTTLVAPSRALEVARDLLFMASTAPLIAACVVRPHRPRPAPLGLAADLALVSVLALFAYAYFAIAHVMVRGANPYEELGPLLYNPQRLLLLGALLWLLRGAQGSWRRLYEEFALAMVVFLAGGVASNLAILVGTYRPGLYDLPWALPFAWMALAARAWHPPAQRPEADETAEAAAWQALDWQEARQGHVVGLAAAVMVPTIHFLATLFGGAESEVARLRGQMALAGTVLVGALYVARQLATLRRAEVTQRLREERFRALVENSADAIGLLDAGGAFTYLSASTERVTGHRPEDLAGTSPLALVHPEERDSASGALEQVYAHARATARGFVRYRHKDGGVRYGAVDVANLLDDPAVGGLVLHLRDVTERRSAEGERERSLSLLEATLEATADGILAVDRGGRIERFNRKCASMWGFPEEVLVSGEEERALGFVVGQLEEAVGFFERVRELYGRPEAEGLDTLRLRDGRIFERHSQPQRLGGEVVGRVWSFRDVTERTRAEEAMARLVAIIEATPDFVGTFDAGLQPLYINRAGRRMVGLSDDEELAGRVIGEFHPPQAAARLLEEAVPTALREGSWSGEGLLRHRDGREVPVLQVVLAHRSSGGEVAFLSTIARDISQRQRAEEELRRSQTMAALGSLVAGVAHEVRNPLFGISSTLDAFEARFAEQRDHHQYFRFFREQLERLGTLMNDLLEYGKPTGLVLSETPLEAVVLQALSACAPLAERAKVVLDSRVDSGMPPLRVDPKRLSQVFRNLIENALQHSPAGGTVRLTAALVRSEGRIWVECVVEDSGPGIRAEDLPHVFEPFFTRRRGGTGLGLSIVERIVAAHGGTLAAQNRPEGGARLTVRLPATAEGPPS